jgi:hypothetical protein
MIKFASIALAAGLGLAAVAQSAPAVAHPYVRVGVGLPFVEPVAIAPAYYGRGYYDYSPYWRPGYARFGHERFYRHWYRR